MAKSTYMRANDMVELTKSGSVEAVSSSVQELAEMLKQLMEEGKKVAFSLKDEDLAERLLGLLKETYTMAVAVIHAVAPAAAAPSDATLALTLSTNVTSMTQSVKSVLSALPQPDTPEGGGAGGGESASGGLPPKSDRLDLAKMKSVIKEVSDLTLDIDNIAQSIDGRRDPERKALFLQINEDINTGVESLVEASRVWAADRQNPELIGKLIDEVYSVETITKNALTVALRDTVVAEIRDAANAASFSATVHAENADLAGFLAGVGSLSQVVITLLQSVTSDPGFVDAHVAALGTTMASVVDGGNAVVASEVNAEAKDRLHTLTASMESSIQSISRLSQHCASNPGDTVSDRDLNASGKEYASAIQGLVKEATGRRKRDTAREKVQAELARNEELLRDQRRAEQERKELQRQERLAKQRAMRERRIAKAKAAAEAARLDALSAFNVLSQSASSSENSDEAKLPKIDPKDRLSSSSSASDSGSASNSNSNGSSSSDSGSSSSSSSSAPPPPKDGPTIAVAVESPTPVKSDSADAPDAKKPAKPTSKPKRAPRASFDTSTELEKAEMNVKVAKSDEKAIQLQEVLDTLDEAVEIKSERMRDIVQEISELVNAMRFDIFVLNDISRPSQDILTATASLFKQSVTIRSALDDLPHDLPCGDLVVHHGPPPAHWVASVRESIQESYVNLGSLQEELKSRGGELDAFLRLELSTETEFLMDAVSHLSANTQWEEIQHTLRSHAAMAGELAKSKKNLWVLPSQKDVFTSLSLVAANAAEILGAIAFLPQHVADASADASVYLQALSISVHQYGAEYAMQGIATSSMPATCPVHMASAVRTLAFEIIALIAITSSNNAGSESQPAVLARGYRIVMAIRNILGREALDLYALDSAAHVLGDPSQKINPLDDELDQMDMETSAISLRARVLAALTSRLRDTLKGMVEAMATGSGPVVRSQVNVMTSLVSAIVDHVVAIAPNLESAASRTSTEATTVANEIIQVSVAIDAKASVDSALKQSVKHDLASVAQSISSLVQEALCPTLQADVQTFSSKLSETIPLLSGGPEADALNEASSLTILMVTLLKSISKRDIKVSERWLDEVSSILNKLTGLILSLPDSTDTRITHLIKSSSYSGAMMIAPLKRHITSMSSSSSSSIASFIAMSRAVSTWVADLRALYHHAESLV